jgi:hypothetical protein
VRIPLAHYKRCIDLQGQLAIADFEHRQIVRRCLDHDDVSPVSVSCLLRLNGRLALLDWRKSHRPAVKKFKDRTTAATRIWKSIQDLGEAVTSKAALPAKPKAERKAKGATQLAKGAPTKGKATKKATAAKNAPQGKRATKTQEATAPREGSKTSQVVAMLQRKNGATLAEIMDKMGWQKHTVRGFMAGAMKKAGFTVESFKPEGGERTYRINK